MESNGQYVCYNNDLFASENNDVKVAALINKVILLLKEEKIAEALAKINNGISKYGKKVILIRARAEAELAAANFLRNLDDKKLYFEFAVESATELLQLVPGAIEFFYFLAKVLASKGCLKHAIAICEEALILRDCDDPFPYEGIQLNWDGKPLESTSLTHGEKVMERINMLIKESKRKLLHKYLYLPQGSVLSQKYLEPNFNPLQCSSRNVPDYVSRYWISLDIEDKIEKHMNFNVFDFLETLGDVEPEASLLDFFYEFSISKEWGIWLCSECPKRFMNGKDHRSHLIREHIDDIRQYCHKDLPHWGKKKVHKIWGLKKDFKGDKLEMLEDVGRGRDLFSEMFELKIDAAYFLDWLYENSSSMDVVHQWEQKLKATRYEVKELREKWMEHIKKDASNMKQACYLLQPDQKKSEKEEMRSELKLMKYQCDLTENLMKFSELSKVDNRLIIEQFVKRYLKDRLEKASSARLEVASSAHQEL